jgi:hypothetical protein
VSAPGEGKNATNRSESDCNPICLLTPLIFRYKRTNNISGMTASLETLKIYRKNKKGAKNSPEAERDRNFSRKGKYSKK